MAGAFAELVRGPLTNDQAEAAAKMKIVLIIGVDDRFVRFSFPKNQWNLFVRNPCCMAFANTNM
jgi:hypothetical protein